MDGCVAERNDTDDTAFWAGLENWSYSLSLKTEWHLGCWKQACRGLRTFLDVVSLLTTIGYRRPAASDYSTLSTDWRLGADISLAAII
ncbi:hypothetical protein HZ326_8608 [Fusarium oxysporum f. sp. albedinis]|nr:hypothetical protein HZ326_8608 [Fusarium oxysporum f. sp. albedinis]